MSFFSRLFGGGGPSKSSVPAPAPAGATPNDAILKLNSTKDMLDKRANHVQKQIDAQMAEARKCSAAKNKRGALAALKRKKLLEGQIEKIHGARLTIDNQIMALEEAHTNVEVLRSMDQGARAMQQLHGPMTVETVDNIREKIEEQMEISNEISDAIIQPFGRDTMDEDELLNELDELESTMTEEQVLQAPSVPVHAVSRPDAATTAFPAPPSTRPVARTEEDELKELEAMMAPAH
eukprot:gnl/Hemi2/12939_TR4422_c0_g1_i1.p1 gnl/Hemi2/12939_TR4422_c0_g1~~gnl/Hemi2/12939_TR4422_c0_g1_i1.p1  ORF type:complete len:236 (+),score=87.20 gnl/Hemi2/12939_TR4422_c0_g1_i1:136-843(+)